MELGKTECESCPLAQTIRRLFATSGKNCVGIGGQRRLSSVVEELIAARSGTGHRERYVNGLRQYLALFARAHDAIPIDCVTPAHIDRWFASRSEAPTTRASNLGRLSALFSFARRRGYCTANPCDNVERVRIERAPPKILSVDESLRLLETCRRLTPAILPAVALGLLAGVRPHEVERMTWSDIDLDERRATVSAAASKVRRRRIVPLAPNCVAWLWLCARTTERLLPPPTTARRLRRTLAASAGMVWHQDILRHTAATYLLARERDAARVALWLGNSPGILLTHYADLVGCGNVDAFWSLAPQ
jgi:integrase